MSGEGPFFLSDPRPEDMVDPDDPRPEDMVDPDDPRPEDMVDPDDPRPEDMVDPDDPRPEDMVDPDDPRPEDMVDPDDPRPEDMVDPDDPRPEDMVDPDDPAARYLIQALRRARRRRCKPLRRRRRCARPRRRPFRFRYSGRVILRLSEHLNLPAKDDISSLWELAEEKDLKLDGLVRVLQQYEVGDGATGRLVDIEDKGLMSVVYGERPSKGGDDLSDIRQGSAGDRGCPEGAIVVRQLWPAQPFSEEPGTEPPTVRQLEERAAGSDLPPLHSLASYWRIDASDLPRQTEPEEGERWHNGWKPSHGRAVRGLVRQLNELPEVDLAYRELAADDPANGTGDTFAGIQEYLHRAPTGIDACWVWQQAKGIEESRIAFADLEQGWIEHLDVTAPSGLVFGDNRHNKGEYRGHHGTAVLGEVLGRHDAAGVGIQGIARDARWVLLSSHWSDAEQTSGNVANAIRHLIPRMEPGDVLLLEVQKSYMPTEVDPLDLDAIRLAVASGIIVIEAAGNGNANLDHYVDDEGRRSLRRRHPDFRESGALMVAAARSELPHNRLSGRVGVGSNYGSRIDCFAQGDRVVTSGYGDLNAYLEPPDVDENEAAPRAYSAYFGGTSGAAPIIAGAALLVQGMHEARTGTRLSPREMRTLLSDPRLGTRQGAGVRGRIGIMPDLRRVLREGLALTANLYVRDNVRDEGHVPVGRRTSASPDIVVLPSGARKPDPQDDDPRCLSRFEKERRYKIFVRLHNRGLREAVDPEIRVFRSPIATLVTPDMWEEVGRVEAPEANKLAAAGSEDLPIWAGPLSFRWRTEAPVRSPEIAGAADAGQRYCFTAIVRDGLDHELDRPPYQWPYYSWRQFRAFMRWRNGVACRSVHPVPLSGGPLTLPFLVSGTTDRALTFDLEIVRSLPGTAQLDLVAHAALAHRLRWSRLWPAQRLTEDPNAIRLTLPRRPRQRIRGVRMVAGSRFPCSFVLSGAMEHGNSLAIRQLYRGREVGRITWRFDRREK